MLLPAGLFVGSVVAANMLTAHFGLIPIGFGLMVTAGTFAAGVSLVARDWVQARSSRIWIIPALILAGAALSALTATPARSSPRPGMKVSGFMWGG